MDSPGKYLKKEREVRNLSLERASKSTRIKEQYLKAIEEDRYDLCPPSFYVRGFLTNYARYLGADPKDVLLKYQELITPSLPPSGANVQEKQKKTFQFHPKIQTKVQPRTTFRVLLISALLLSLLIPLYSYIDFHPPMGRNPTSQSSQKLVIPEVAQETGARPVLEQIKHMELIGPNEVQAEALYQVTDAQLGTAVQVEDGRPRLVGKASEFECENQRVYFFTRIATPKEGKIVHVWRCEEKEQCRIEMTVKSPSWSVYSHIFLYPARSGNWKVEVWGGDRLLKSVSFKAYLHKDTPAPS
jgi:hypothetical protein